MALELPYRDQYLVSHDAAYWKLTGFEYSNEQRLARLTFSCYASKEARDQGGVALTIKQFTLQGEEFESVDAMLASFKPQVYEFAKNKTEKRDDEEFIFFAGAKDV